MSLDSRVGGVELPPLESRDRVEADGESTFAGSGDAGLGGAAGGVAAGLRFLPLPRILPPPMLRLDMARNGSHRDEVRVVGR